jgi:glucose-6-phosphate isomerase
VPCDFLVAATTDGETAEDRHQHALLLANCLAQSEALMRGRTLADAGDPHKVCPGDRPSNTLLYRRLDPHTLGMILALYEHKVFVQGAIWGIDSFDQWGVELGKTLAEELLPMVEGEAQPTGRDASTMGLIAAVRQLQGTR